MLMQKIGNERIQLESSNACHDRVASGKGCKGAGLQGCKGARVQGCKAAGVAMFNEYKEVNDDETRGFVILMQRLQRYEGCKEAGVARVQECKGIRVQRVCG